MIAAACAAAATLAIAAALRPRPDGRGFGEPVSRRRRRRRHSFRRGDRAVGADEVAGWCEHLARSLRGGSTLTSAFCGVDPPTSCRGVVDDAVLAVRRGTRLADALAISTPSTHLDMAITVLRACAINGGTAAEPLDRAAIVLRGRAADAAERRTQSAQARLSALVMTILPVAMLALMLLTSPATRSAAAQPVGVTAIAAGGALNVIGWRWMQRIVGRLAG